MRLKPPDTSGRTWKQRQKRFQRPPAARTITLEGRGRGRYKDVLQTILRFGPLTTADIGAYLESPGKGHFGTLQRLYQGHFLERRYLPTRSAGWGSGPTLHFLTRQGAAHALGDVYDDEDDGEHVDKLLKRSPRTLEHGLAVSQVLLLIELGARAFDELRVVRSFGDKEEPWLRLTVRMPATKRSPRGPLATRWPDGLVTIEQGTHRRTYLLEVDLDDTHARRSGRFLDRFRVYGRALTEGVRQRATKRTPEIRRSLGEQLKLDEQQKGRWPLQVLFLAKTAARRDALRTLAQVVLKDWQADAQLQRLTPPFFFGALEGWTHDWDPELQDYVRRDDLRAAAKRLYEEPMFLGMNGKPAHFWG